MGKENAAKKINIDFGKCPTFHSFNKNVIKSCIYKMKVQKMTATTTILRERKKNVRKNFDHDM